VVGEPVGVVGDGHHPPLGVDSPGSFQADRIHQKGVAAPDVLQLLVAGLATRGCGRIVLQPGGSRGVVADEGEETPHRFGPPGRFQVRLRCHPVDHIRELVEDRGQGLHENHLQISGGPAGPLGEPACQLFEHEASEAVVVPHQPVKVVPQSGQRRGELYPSFGAVGAVAFKGQYALRILGHGLTPGIRAAPRGRWRPGRRTR